MKYLEYLEEEWNRPTRITAKTERQNPRSKTDLGVPSRGKNESNTKEVYDKTKKGDENQ